MVKIWHIPFTLASRIARVLHRCMQVNAFQGWEEPPIGAIRVVLKYPRNAGPPSGNKGLIKGLILRDHGGFLNPLMRPYFFGGLAWEGTLRFLWHLYTFVVFQCFPIHPLVRLTIRVLSKSSFGRSRITLMKGWMRSGATQKARRSFRRSWRRRSHRCLRQWNIVSFFAMSPFWCGHIHQFSLYQKLAKHSSVFLPMPLWGHAEIFGSISICGGMGSLQWRMGTSKHRGRDGGWSFRRFFSTQRIHW